MEFKSKRYWGFIRSALRRQSLKYPPRNEVLKAARRPYKGPNKRQKWETQCAQCENWFKATEVQVDHIKPCGELTDAKHIKSFVLGLFCKGSNLQVLCKECHNEKTKLEKANDV